MAERMSYKDFTLKAVIDGHEKIEIHLKNMNSIFVGIDYQKDTYFKAQKGKLKLREGTIENLITHYERTAENGIEKTIVYQYEINPTQGQIKKLFNDNGILGIVEKIRKIYFIDDCKIHLDTTPDNKTFIEIEAIDRTGIIPDEVLRQKCHNIREKLGIETSALIKTGYLLVSN